MSHRRGAPSRIWPWRLAWALILVAGLLVKWSQPPQYIFTAGYDDLLMVQMAHGFLLGHWSSPWATSSWVTMAKPVGYPLFLAGAHYAPWSPLVSVDLVYLLGSSLIAWSWRRMSGSRPQATGILLALVLSPALYPSGLERIYRDSFIEALGALAIGLSFVVAAELDARGRASEPGGSAVLRALLLVVLVVGIGVSIGFSAITKPTWYWMVPAVLAPLAHPLVRRIRQGPHRLKTALCAGLAAAVAVVSCGAVIEATIAMNKRTYGVALVEDLSSGGLARAWETWASVRSGPTKRFEPITREMRLAVYRVSPAARRLEPYIYSRSDPFVEASCAPREARSCDDPGRYLEWALQWAAARTGQVNSEVQFQRFFNTLADQIHAACRSGRLTCTKSPVLATGLPPLDQIPPATVGSETAVGIWKMVTEDYPFGPDVVRKPPLFLYREWAEVIPHMQRLDSVATVQAPVGVYWALRFDDAVFRILNVALLLITCLTPIAWLATRSRPRRREERTDLAAGATGAFFLLATVIGMGVLAVFNVGQSPTYINGLYWSDFAVPCELFVLFGAIAVWPVLRGSRRRPPEAQRAGGPASKTVVVEPEAELVGSNTSPMGSPAKAPGLDG